MNTRHRVIPWLLAGALLPQALAAQPDQQNRIPYERLNEEPSLEERITEERAVAERSVEVTRQARQELEPLSEEQLVEAEVRANDGSPPPGSAHATSEAPAELVALAAREPDRFLGKTLVLHDGTEAVRVGPVLALRKRILDQEAYLIVDATSYFKVPTQYAIAVRDLDRIDADMVRMPEADGMHLRGLEYYPEDFIELESTAPEDVLAAQLEEERIDAEEEDEEAGVQELKRF